MRDDLTAAAYAAGWSTVRRMPEPVARGTFNAIADQAWLRHGASVRQLERNLARVRPDLDTHGLRSLSREGMRSHLRYYREAFRLPDLSREQLLGRIRVDDEHILTDALASGRGVVISLPHSGNWDHAGAWFTLAHAPLTTVAERLKPEELYERFLNFRRGLGMEVLPLTGGGSGPFRTLLQRVREGRLVCLLGDRDLGRNGVDVTFFGEPTRMPAGPAALALGSGAALLVASLWFEDGLTRVRFHPEIPHPPAGPRDQRSRQMTQAVAAVFESGIRGHPQDWHMLQPLWLADLDQDRLARRDAPAPTA